MARPSYERASPHHHGLLGDGRGKWLRMNCSHTPCLSERRNAQTVLSKERGHGDRGHPLGFQEGVAGRERTHHRSWAPATRRARLSGHRRRRSWPRRCTGSPCRRSRSRRRSGNSAGRAGGSQRGDRPQTWRTPGESMPPPRTWLWGRVEGETGLGEGPATELYSEILTPAPPCAASAAKTTLGSGTLCDLSCEANILS